MKKNRWLVGLALVVFAAGCDWPMGERKTEVNVTQTGGGGTSQSGSDVRIVPPETVPEVTTN